MVTDGKCEICSIYRVQSAQNVGQRAQKTVAPIPSNGKAHKNSKLPSVQTLPPTYAEETQKYPQHHHIPAGQSPLVLRLHGEVKNSDKKHRILLRLCHQ